MRHRVTVLFRRGDTEVAASAMDSEAAALLGMPDGELTLKVVPSMSARDEAIFLLHTAAEIEHSLMVQYLYAAWSLPQDGPDRVPRWRSDILQIAREEMGHLAAVQNLLRFIGGPLNFDREDFPFRTDFYPFPFRLERLGRVGVARFVAAEMPAEPDVDPDLLTEVKRLASGEGQVINRIGALYNRLSTLFADKQRLPDDLFRPGTAEEIQALPARYRADVGRGPLYLRTVRNRDEALALLADITSQGEGERDMPDSHFFTLLDIFDTWPTDNDTISLDVPTHPNTTPAGGDIEDPDLAAGRITHPRARAWALIFNHHYRMLLAWLQHALLTRTTAAAGTGLSLRAFAEMLGLSDVGQLLTTLPRTDNNEGRAAAPFELPYSLAFPDLPEDRWTYHRDLLISAQAQLDALGAGITEAEEQTRRRLLRSIADSEEFVAAHAHCGGPATPDATGDKP
ncbi:MAG: ferritin-like domain-containing protein [Pseudonocardiaceae bacterium]